MIREESIYVAQCDTCRTEESAYLYEDIGSLKFRLRSDGWNISAVNCPAYSTCPQCFAERESVRA